MSADPCATEAAWLPWNLCVTVDEPDTYGYGRSFLKTPGLAVVWETFTTPCRLRGLAPPDSLVLAVPLQVGARSRYWGRAVSPDWLPAMRSGGIDWIVDSWQSHVMLVVTRALAYRHVDVNLQLALARATNAHPVPVKSSAVESLGANLLGLLDEAARGAETWSPTAVTSVEQELLQRLTEVIDVARLRNAKPDGSSRRAGIERALEHLRVASLAAVKRSELAEVAGMSARTLEHGFRDLFGLTPLGFLHLLRLHAVRRELRAGDGACRTVREIADHWGFHQHGRFSGYYRRAFGELPSETRQRAGRPAKGRGSVGTGDPPEKGAKASRARTVL